ncbi:2,3-bisphosphoglycerate-independent phosphoglycerate mutase [Rhodovulum sp. DZ06]|uniref:2,3-bisphosphoglycerate-independent phosphoglycerate mutase n=1 Tax=Rhodovulum sp. DZ06 TaxID=3425126 RepID=UPI003D34AF83
MSDTAPAPGEKRPVVLVILDGWGLSDRTEANAVALAETPNFDRIHAECPASTLTACGNAVGLPEGQMGNSEVGHMNIGAGRIVWMDLPKIDKAIETGDFAARPALQKFIADMTASGGTAHLAGLLGPGGVHAHSRHMAAAARVIAAAGIPVVLHLYADGRDTPPASSRKFLGDLVAALPHSGVSIGTVSGRFYAMDRDKRWDRVEAAFRAMTAAEGERAPDAEEAIIIAASKGETDEFITPTVIEGYEGMKDGDGLLFLNFRADRAREILSALADPEFSDFDVSARPAFAAVAGMVEYSDRHNDFMGVLFPSDDIVNTLGEWTAKHGRTQFHIAETEKYPHVTFFLNGGLENPYEGETRYMAPSPKVRTYDMQPEMSAPEVTEHLADAIRSRDYDLIVCNYANPDMVGHTGDLQAAMAACAEVDRGLGEALKALEEAGGAMIVTADHGNCDMMVDPETGGPHTAHTLNPVPVILVGGPEGATLRKGGVLGDLAPTLLQLMGLPQPAEMTGESLIA